MAPIGSIDLLRNTESSSTFDNRELIAVIGSVLACCSLAISVFYCACCKKKKEKEREAVQEVTRRSGDSNQGSLQFEDISGSKINPRRKGWIDNVSNRDAPESERCPPSFLDSGPRSDLTPRPPVERDRDPRSDETPQRQEPRSPSRPSHERPLIPSGGDAHGPPKEYYGRPKHHESHHRSKDVPQKEKAKPNRTKQKEPRRSVDDAKTAFNVHETRPSPDLPPYVSGSDPHYRSLADIEDPFEFLPKKPPAPPSKKNAKPTHR